MPSITPTSTEAITHTCEGCGSTFERKSRKGPKPRFCKRSCSPARTKPREAKPCDQCGETLGKFRSRFCSVGCQREFHQPVPLDDKECKDCGEVFVPYAKHHSRCGVCAVRYKELSCDHCGEQFTGHRPRSDRSGKSYCSDECLGADRRVDAERVPWKDCTVCHNQFVGRAVNIGGGKQRWAKCPTCHPEPIGPCRPVNGHGRIARIFGAGNCAHCGDQFTAVTYSLSHMPRYCSGRCRRNFLGGGGNHDDRGRKAARITGARYEPINRTRVLEADGYVCHLCGLTTDPDAPLYSDRYPSLDHVVPLSLGGGHTYDNIRCACFGCNWRKGDGVDVAESVMAEPKKSSNPLALPDSTAPPAEKGGYGLGSFV